MPADGLEPSLFALWARRLTRVGLAGRVEAGDRFELPTGLVARSQAYEASEDSRLLYPAMDVSAR